MSSSKILETHPAGTLSPFTVAKFLDLLRKWPRIPREVADTLGQAAERRTGGAGGIVESFLVGYEPLG